MSNKKIKCSKCGSSQTYLRLLSDERVCRNCGNIEKIKLNLLKVEDKSTGEEL